MLKRIQHYIEKHNLLTSGATVIVGVSGGVDSVVLLHILKNLGYNCIVAHCNFHLRSDESDRDELFVRNLAKTLHLQMEVINFQTVEYATTNKLSIEMAARELRYEWFYVLLEKYQAECIAVAHHADDNIETLLMNLIRGTGLKGMTGIPTKNEKVIRPLLCCNRSEIEEYLTANKLSHITDSTNASSKYLRNKYRNEIIPNLEEINPSVRNTLYDTIERFEGIHSFFQQAMQKTIAEIVIQSDNRLIISIIKLKEQGHTSTILYEILAPYGFSASTIEQVSENIDGESGKLYYSNSHCLLKDRECLIMEPLEIEKNKTFHIQKGDIEVKVPILMNISNIRNDHQIVFSKDAKEFYFDADKIKFPLTLRHWQEGDAFYPFGMKNKKKVSDFFIDNKLSRFDKENCWLLLSGNDIMWIVGYRTDNRFKITENTINVLKISL